MRAAWRGRARRSRVPAVHPWQDPGSWLTRSAQRGYDRRTEPSVVASYPAAVNSDPNAILERMSRRTPFFLLGTGRCGSTWIYQLLERHPQVALTDEARFVDLVWFFSQFAGQSNLERRAWDTRPRQELTGMVTEHFTETAARSVTEQSAVLLGDFYERVAGRQDFTHWGDKLPDARAARALQSLWPQTKFALIVRDPRDNYCSYRQFARKPEILAKYPELSTITAADFARDWRTLNTGCLDHLEPLHVIRYEEMVAAPDAQLAQLLEFLELPPHPDVHVASERPAAYAGHGTTRSVAQSVGRWQEELDERDVAVIDELTGEHLQRFGYRPGT